MARHKKYASPPKPESTSEGLPEAPAQKRSKVKVSHFWLGIFVFSLLFGYQQGKANRPLYKDHESSGSLTDYISRHADIVMPEWSGDRLAGGVVSFTCGVDRYRWDMQAGTLLTETEYDERLRKRVDVHAERIRAQSGTPNLRESSLWTTYSAHMGDIFSEEMAEPGTPHEGTSVTDLIELVAGGAGAYTATHTAQEAVQYWRRIRRTPFAKKVAGGAVLVATGAIGFKFGYAWAYEDAPPCATSDVLHMLQPARRLARSRREAR